MTTNSGRSYRGPDGQPSLTVLEGGKTTERTPLIPGSWNKRLGAVALGLLVVAFGTGKVVSGVPDGNGLRCDSETKPLIVPADQAPSVALGRQVSGLSNEWKQIAQVPVTDPSGDTKPFGSYGPSGPPAGSKVPLFCEEQ